MANVRINYIVDKSQVDAADDALRDLNRTEGITEKSTQKLSNKFRDVNTDAGRAKRGVADVGNELKKFNNLASNAGKLLAGLFAVSQLTSFAKSIVETTGKFQTFEAVLTNTLGSNSKAKRALNDLSAFAAKTPFAIDQLTASFVKLANQGFTPTTDELRKLGDLASSTGKDFDMLTEALIDAQVGEFERLKEFGIRASKEGDKVRFTFKGIETQTDFTNESIRNYILSLGDLEGVSGSMAAISQTVTGKVSNLGDNITQLQKNIGDSNSGLISGVLDLANNALSAMNDEMSKSARLADALEERGIMKPGFWERLQFAADNFFSADKPEWLQEYEKAAKEATAEIEELDKMTAAFQETITGLSEGEQLEAINKGLENFKDNPRFIQYLNELKEGLISGSKNVNDLNVSWDELTESQQKAFIAMGESTLSIQEGEKALADFNAEMMEFLNLSGTANEEKGVLKAFEEQKKVASELDKILEQILVEGEAANQAYYATATELNKEFTDDYKEKSEERKRIDEEESERKKALINESINLALSAADSLTAIQQNRLQQEINQLEQQKNYEVNLEGRTSEEKAAIQSRFDAQILELRKEQARKEKALALFNIAVQTAENAIRLFALTVPPGILSAVAIGVGALQAGVVASTPLPFNKGTKRVPGYGDVDSVPAILTPGEKVFDKGTSKAYGPVLDAIFDHKIRPEVLNGFIRNGGSQVVVNNDMSQVAKALRSQPKKLVTIDKSGFTAFQISESQKITKKLNRYKG